MFITMSNRTLLQVSGPGVQEVSVADSVMLARYPGIEESRQLTIAKLWNITETLNVLYRDNWTMMANLEMIKFQNEIIQSIKEEMTGGDQETHCNFNKVGTHLLKWSQSLKSDFIKNLSTPPLHNNN